MKKPVLLLTMALTVVLLFSSTAYATAGPLDLNDFVAISEFDAPNGPITTTASKLASGAAGDAPVKLTMVDDVTPLFPASGEMVLGLATTNAGGTELIVYDTTTDPCGGQALGTKDVCVTARAKVGQQKQHPSGTFVQLATQLTADMPGAASVAHTTLETAVSETQAMSFAISVGSDANFGTSGYLTISHQDTTTGAGAVGAASPEPASEYFEYDRSCGSASQLCLTVRALQPNKEQENHPADGYDQPGAEGHGHSKVDKHDQITVKTDGNDGFFPTGNLMIYQVDGSNNVINAELVGRSQVQNVKPVTIPGNQFHVTTRGGSASTYKKTDIVAHPAGSIVVSASSHLFCRNRNVQPNPATPTLTNSVGVFPMCYTQQQPNLAPKVGGNLNVPVVGSTLIVMNALNQPSLSTGGYTHILYGVVPDVDATGPNAGTKDGELKLISPCILDFTPGSNLQVQVTIDVSDNLFSTPDPGTIKVTTDTIRGAPYPGDCDDPAGWAPITVTGYDWPGGKVGDTDPSAADDDTDGDGCTDAQELDNNVGTGGQRDPWNPYDFFDPNGDGFVGIDDLNAVVEKYGSTPPGPPYTTAHDRGLTYGPMGHNLSGPDGDIVVTDVFAVAAQVGHRCRPAGPGDPLDAAAAFVDPSQGGTVSTGTDDAAEATLTIPAGSLSGSPGGQGAGPFPGVLITVEAFADSDAPSPQAFLPRIPNPQNAPLLLERVFDLGPEGTILNNPAQLVLTYDDAGMTEEDEQALGIYHFDEAASEWRLAEIIGRDTVANTITVAVEGFSIWGPMEPIVDDTDTDGCIDVKEFSSNAALGGRRSPADYWDFYDTPDLSNLRDQAIAVTDIFAVSGRFGATGDASGSPLAGPIPAAPAYHTAFDRGGTDGDNVWNQAPADGAIAIGDIFAVAAQFGHQCALP